MMEPLIFGGTYIKEPNYSQLQAKCLEEPSVKHPSTLPYHYVLVKKKNFNDAILPGHVDKNTVFGIKTKSNIGIGDVIFPKERCAENENFTELYKISHHDYGIGERLNRKYTTHFDPAYRYGVHLKRLPAGAWFKTNVKQITSDEDKNDITDYVSKLLESEKRENCNRYPYVDQRQGKFLGRSYLNAGDILTGNMPNEKELEVIDYLSAINKMKCAVKKKKCNLKELRDKYISLDQELTGWLPLELVYEVCFSRQVRPEKKMFELALNSMRAIDNDNVRYDLFVDLLDPNVQFSVNIDRSNKPELDRFVPTYKTDYENTFSRSVQLNKNLGNDASSHRHVKPLVLAHQECLGSETDVKTLLSPTIFSNYGLTYKDFYKGRSKNVMEKLFKDIGVTLPNDIFNIIWNNAYQCDGFDDQVSVEAFKRALQELAHKMIYGSD